MDRTEILIIVNEYLLLDVISGGVTSNKELVNKMVDELASQLEPQVMQKIAEDEKKLLDMLFASKIAEIQAHIIYGEPLEQRMGKVKLAEKLDDLHKKLKSNFSA